MKVDLGKKGERYSGQKSKYKNRKGSTAFSRTAQSHMGGNGKRRGHKGRQRSDYEDLVYQANEFYSQGNGTSFHLGDLTSHSGAMKRPGYFIVQNRFTNAFGRGRTKVKAQK